MNEAINKCTQLIGSRKPATDIFHFLTLTMSTSQLCASPSMSLLAPPLPVPSPPSASPTIINLDALVNRRTLYFTPVNKIEDLPYPEWLLVHTLAIEEIFWPDGWTYVATFSRPFNLDMLNQIMLNFRWKACLCRPTTTRADGTIEHAQRCPDMWQPGHASIDGPFQTNIIFRK